MMIRDLVLYFLRQGVYNGEGDIAVLCAYLGQLQKVRAAFRDMKLAVSVDERDEEQLAKQGLEEEVSFQEVTVAKHVRASQKYLVFNVRSLTRLVTDSSWHS
jgi:hypothetical protein